MLGQFSRWASSREHVPDKADDQAMLLYDRDCGFCRWTLAKLLAWDRDGRLRPVALQDPEAEHLLPHLDPQARLESFHLVTADGSVHSAGAAVPPLLELLPHGRLPARLARAWPSFTDAAYALVARHRSRLGKLVRGR